MAGKQLSLEDMRILENAKAAAERERLEALAALDVLDSPPERAFDSITMLAADRFDTPIALVSLVSEDRQWFKAQVGLDVTETGRDISFCQHGIQSDEVMVVLDARDDPRFRDNPLVLGAPDIRFYAGAPLKLQSGHRIGTLCVIDRTPRAAFSARDRRALELMAQQVVDQLEIRRLRRSQQISHLIGETTLDAFVCADAESRIIHWNRAAEVMFGWPASEALGQTLEMIIPDRHRAAHNAGMERMRAGAPPRLVGKTVEVPATHRSGDEVPVELSLAMWSSEPGRPADGFAAIIRDISARKAMEAEREATQERLAEQVAAMEASNDGIAVTDPDGRFIFMNESHATMFGFPDGTAALGRHWSELYADEEHQRLEQQAFPILAEKHQWRGQARGRRLDGCSVDQEISLSLRSNGGIVCVTRDVGARQQAEREMARLREQLLAAQRQEAVGQLASGIAHDFNNLIAAIAGSAALIQGGGEPKAKRQADRIQAAAGAAASLVAKMLSLGARKPERHELDLGQPLASVAELVRTSLPQAHQLVISLPEQPVLAMADSTELMQVLLNLAINARDAMDRDRDGRITLSLLPPPAALPAGKIRVGAVPEGPWALIRVADTGAGMAANLLDRIFEPFYSSKGAAGSGLGLSVVAGIVESAGAGLIVGSSPGTGSCFDLLWPLNPPRQVQAAMPTPARNGLLVGRGVLVVDDNPAVVDVLAELLEQAGAEVGPCLEAADALAAVREDPDAWYLLITDFDMPGMDGAALAQEARALKPDLPVLLCTALPEAHRSSAARAAIFDAIVGKPVTLPSLLDGAEAAIQARAAKSGAQPSGEQAP
jgi:PAS domain S-box-containing protein